MAGLLPNQATCKDMVGIRCARVVLLSHPSRLVPSLDRGRDKSIWQ